MNEVNLNRGPQVQEIEHVMPRTILFLDNTPDFLNVYTELLEGEGYRILKSDSIWHARRLLETENIHLALVDIRVRDDDDPDDVSGLTVVVDEQFRNLPKIVLTSYSSTDTMGLALRPEPNQLPSAVDYLEKRKGFTALLCAIENAFKR